MFTIVVRDGKVRGVGGGVGGTGILGLLLQRNKGA